MSHRKTLSVVAVMLTAAAAFSAEAGEGKGPGKAMERITQADKDGDGRISREEAASLPRLAKGFDKVDANKDGFVTKEEMHAMRGQHDHDRLARMDTDRDGKISKAEADRFPRLSEHFGKLDTNGDGFLSQDELKAGHRKHKPHA